MAGFSEHGDDFSGFIKCGNFLTSSRVISFSRGTPLYLMLISLRGISWPLITNRQMLEHIIRFGFVK